MTLQKNDFIKIEFTGKTEDGKLFDSNIKEELEKANIKGNSVPFIFPIGRDMFLKGIDDYLIGKELGNHKITLNPENAFGKRDPKQIQMIPKKIFIQHQINPIPGASMNFDGKMGRILTVSGGRTIVDFNHPLAGKEVIYEINVLEKVTDINEKVSALNDFFFRQKFEFEVKDKKVTIKTPTQFKQFIELFKDKYKDILDLEIETKEIKDTSKNETKQDKEKINKEESTN
ncbi:MAG: peptidylprolyl isomerase [Nanoarchaeota archaeon]|nr:peptidylprolyl isomerase [Nanoarchaeota archaeon]